MGLQICLQKFKNLKRRQAAPEGEQDRGTGSL